MSPAAFTATRPSIILMMQEHVKIRRMCDAIRVVCTRILEGAEVPVADLRDIIVYVREYSDQHHHAKEEKFLFPAMVEHLGKPAENLVTHGMLVEHDLGRAHVLELENTLYVYEDTKSIDAKLDIIVEAMGYAKLLIAHTNKEDAVVYSFAERNLDPKVFDEVDEGCAAYELEHPSDSYDAILERIESKYAK